MNYRHMKVVVVDWASRASSAGVRGRRLRASIDPFNLDAEYRCIEDVPLADYDAPSLHSRWPKQEILSIPASRKHCWSRNHLDEINRGDQRARSSPQQGRRLLYAYNHRFEPHFMRMGNW